MTNLLVSFYWDFGRQGEIEGLFICTREELEAAYHRDAYLGEVLGKHSDISGMLEPEDFTIKSDDQAFIAQLEKVMGTRNISGHNPLTAIGQQ